MKKNKFLVWLAFVCLAAACAFALPFSAGAAEQPATNLSARLIKHASQAQYRRFDNPQSVAADGTRLYVADNESISVFSAADNTPVATLTADSAVKKLAVYSDLVITLEQDGIGYYLADAKGKIAGDYSDIARAGGRLYAIKGGDIVSFEILSSSVSAVETTVLSGVRARAIAGGNSRLLYSAADKNSDAFASVYCYEPTGGASGLWADGLKDFTCLAVTAADDGFIGVWESGAAAYEYVHGGVRLAAQLPESGITAAAAYGNYAVFLKNDKSVFTSDASLNGKNTVFASSSAQLDFYTMPAGVTTKKGNIYVADKGNDRIKVVDETKARSFERALSRPIDVAADHLGNVYAAHSVYGLACFSADGSLIFDETLKIDEMNIAALETDSAANLYILNKNGNLYIRPRGTGTQLQKRAEGVLKVAAVPDSTLLYLIKSSGVYRLNKDAEELVGALTLPQSLSDACFDKDGNLFALLSGGTIEKYALSGGVYTKAILPAFEAGREIGYTTGSITVSTVSFYNGLEVKKGDLLVASTSHHALYSIDGKAAGVAVTDFNGTLPDISGDDLPEADSGAGIIRTITAVCELYPVASDIKPIKVLPEGFRVIVPEIDADSAFTFIIADNTSGGAAKPLAGYVYTDFLSQPLPYTSDHPEEARVWSYPVAVYKWPARQAPVLKGYSEIVKDSKMKLLDFVYEGKGDSKTYGYTDNYLSDDTFTWYKVAIGENGEYVGYVIKDGMSVYEASPDPTVRPQTNAVIVSPDKNNPQAGAQTFELKDGVYVPLNAPALSVGTKVEVIGRFDTSLRYTLIKYGSEYGTVTAYVLTENLKYNGVNTVAIVALVVGILAAALILVLVLRAVYIKKTRRVS